MRRRWMYFASLTKIMRDLYNQYNQQSKSDVEEICIYQNMESASGHHSIFPVYLKVNT